MNDCCQAELFVLVDSNGDYAIGLDESAAREAYENDTQALSDCEGFRLVKLTVAIPLPAVVELAATAPTLPDVPAVNVQ